MNELQNLSQIFQNKIFRIPDYQRGYAWQDLQLRDFWEDIVNLQVERYHYTGLLSLKVLSRAESQKLGNDDRWLLQSGFKAYHIVDGQQRLTTFVIMLNEIIEFVCHLPENEGKSDEFIYLGFENIKDIRAKYVCRKRPPDGLIVTYMFGYENDNPSAEYLKYRILGQPFGGTIKETYYTKNLKYAKDFFTRELQAFYEIKGIDGIAELYRKLTLQLMFNIHEIEDDYDVFVAFETMNNRGKRLTNLELLKNRLIYLTTLYPKEILDETNEVALRELINKAWMEVYYQLGRNENDLLSDDEFLRAHWIMYFAYSRKKGDDYIKFLLRKFSHKSIFENVLQPLSEEEDADDDHQDTDHENRRISPALVEFRHVFEIHTVPADDQRQRHEDAGDHRQEGKIFILLLICLGLAQVAQLDRISRQRTDTLVQSLDPLIHQMEVPLVLLPEKPVLVLLQLLADIDQFLIVQVQVAQIVADLRDCFQLLLRLSGKNLLLDRIEPPVVGPQILRVRVNDLLQKII